ncbi:hypothetical protein K7B10_27895 [Streptomyces flavotricini]|uniref:Uncharacterized protein n=1 Tax=Streptomyces flavotricini TaxID=66888 RepID=A0ABS8EBX4_9ACTN|nr:hypothetical protein [Streptomyces flavotricini]MCC0098523.1 hypothetical protein [Streptomyces flavotricini]
MSGEARSVVGGGAGPRPGALGRFAAAVCSGVLLLGHLVTGYVLLLACAVEPDGPWDRQAVAGSGFAAGAGLCLAALLAPFSWVFVKARRLRAWWFVRPVATAVPAVLRLTLAAPEL